VSVEEWIDELTGYVKHIHINDNDGCEDLHLAVGNGKMDWSILKSKKLFKLDPSVLIEVSGTEKLEASYEYLRPFINR
jgi:sugar phosphate isomerase/epimerase